MGFGNCILYLENCYRRRAKRPTSRDAQTSRTNRDTADPRANPLADSVLEIGAFQDRPFLRARKSPSLIQNAPITSTGNLEIIAENSTQFRKKVCLINWTTITGGIAEQEFSWFRMNEIK